MITAALITDGPPDYDASVPVAGIHPLRRLVQTFKHAGVERVLIAGKSIMREAEKSATRLGAEFIYESDVGGAHSSYLKNAADHLRNRSDRVLLIPANYSLADVSTIITLMASDSEAAIPLYRGRRGYPIIIPTAYLNELDMLCGDIEALLKLHPPLEIDSSDEGVCADVLSDIDSDTIAESREIHKLSVFYNLSIRREKSLYGPGLQQIVRLVGETGSLKKTEKMMGLSHSHAYKIVRTAEDGLGFDLFSDARGLNKITPDPLTKEGREFFEDYEAFSEECGRFIRASFGRYFGKYYK